MKAIILAAGKGRRLGTITNTLPKSLVPVAGRPIIEHTLDSLPDEIRDVYIVIGHLGEKIIYHLGANWKGRKIHYITQAQPLGTGHAIMLLKKYLEKDSEKFIILNGDDMYSKSELDVCLRHPYAFGLSRQVPRSEKYLSIQLNNENNISGYDYPSQEEMNRGILIGTGVYVTDRQIFNIEPVQIANGEYGLPQMMLELAKIYPVAGVPMYSWIQINYPEDITHAELSLKSFY